MNHSYEIVLLPRRLNLVVRSPKILTHAKVRHPVNEMRHQRISPERPYAGYLTLCPHAEIEPRYEPFDSYAPVL